MGLVVFGVMALYLLISIFVVMRAISHAKKQAKSTKRWGWGAALVMYLIPFWDLLPTLAAEKYHCAAESGFFVYKTLDQWREQNPRVFEKLSLTHLPEQHRIDNDPLFKSDRRYRLPDGTLLTARLDVRRELMYVEFKKPDGQSGYQINERFRYTRKADGPGLIKLAREELVVFDSLNGDVIARQIDFWKSTEGTIWGVAGNSWWKFWFQSYDSCFKSNPDRFPNGGIHGYINTLRTDCTPEKEAERDAARLRNGIVMSCR